MQECPPGGGGGYFHQNHMWMCLPDLENLIFSIPIFCLISQPSVYHFQKTIIQFWPNWVLFTIICPKYTQFYNLGSFNSDENPLIAVPDFAKKRPKRQAHIRIPCHIPPSPPPPPEGCIPFIPWGNLCCGGSLLLNKWVCFTVYLLILTVHFCCCQGWEKQCGQNLAQRWEPKYWPWEFEIEFVKKKWPPHLHSMLLRSG